MGTMVGGGLGIGGIVIALVAYFLGVDPAVVTNVADQVSNQRQDVREVPRGAPADEAGVFVSKVLGSTEDVWGNIFRQSGAQYRAPTLVLYDGQVRSACGMGQAAMGPFYCPGDEKLYIDLAFFRDLQTRFRRPGRLRPGLRDRPRGRPPRAEAHRRVPEDGSGAGALAGRAEPHLGTHGAAGRLLCRRVGTPRRHDEPARCRRHRRGRSMPPPRSATTACRTTQGRVVPESFTHGSSEQRVRWFKRGMDSGRPKDCDTFSTGSL